MTDNAKLIEFGRVTRKSGEVVPLYYLYEIEDGKAIAGSIASELIDVKEPYDPNWRKRRDSAFTEE